MVRRIRHITVAVLMVGGLLVGPTPAGAAPLACGTILTVSTTLTTDMSCPDDAIVVEAPGVILDLGGHTIAGGGGAEGAGVRVLAGGVTVRNGRITGFRYGVYLGTGSSGSLVQGLSLTADIDGVHVLSSSNRIRQNLITASPNVAVLLADHGNLVEANSLQRNSAGIFMLGPNDILTNDIVGEFGDDRGILGFRGGRVSGNRVSHYQGPAGIELLNGGEVSGNQVTANVDGIRVGGAATVRGNVAFGNLDDGIQAGPGAIVQGNIAVRNADLGIEAPGAIDAGGNRAFANGNPLQCAGVACSG